MPNPNPNPNFILNLILKHIFPLNINNLCVADILFGLGRHVPTMYVHCVPSLIPILHPLNIGRKQAQRSEGQWRNRRNGVKFWVTLHLQSLSVLLLLRTWWGHLTVWCVWQRYREHHTLQFWSGLIMDPPPRPPANPHPVTCRGKVNLGNITTHKAGNSG